MSRQSTSTVRGSLARVAAAAVAVSLAGATALSMALSPVSSAAASASIHNVPASNSTSAGVTSTNWAGYEVQGGTYTSVSASWTQPTVQPTASRHVAVFWVGLDGAISNTVEQCGTIGQSENGRTTYHAWYEMYPAGWVLFSNAAVHPGDHIEATTVYQQGRYTLTVADSTQGWTRTAHARAAGLARSSAEVIAESPTIDGSQGPLANFSPVTFSGITFIGTQVNNPIPVTMASAGRTAASVDGLAGGTFTASPRR